MKLDVVALNFEPGPEQKESFGPSPSHEPRDPITPAAWEASFTAALPLVKSMLRRYLHNAADVLDAVPQTALKATAHRQQFRAESSLATWLVTLALNEARELRRKQRRDHAAVSLDLLDQTLGDRQTASPEELARRAEWEAWVRQAVRKLPPAYQVVVRLCDLEEHSLEQAAQLLRMTPAAVKSRRFRASHLLAKRFLQQHGPVKASAVDPPSGSEHPTTYDSTGKSEPQPGKLVPSPRRRNN